MNPEDTKNRKYKSSPLPVFEGAIELKPGSEELITLYEQICTSWRTLIDIRFKLLALVPAVSVLLLANLLSTEGPAKGLSSQVKIAIAVLGFVATVGLLIYDLRNSELHDDLISRGRKIEELWGIHTGQFRGRLESKNWFIKHDRATAMIYIGALVGWIFGVVTLSLGL